MGGICLSTTRIYVNPEPHHLRRSQLGGPTAVLIVGYMNYANHLDIHGNWRKSVGWLNNQAGLYGCRICSIGGRCSNPAELHGYIGRSNRGVVGPGGKGVSGWLPSSPHRIFRDQVGSTCSRARYPKREVPLLQRECRVKLTKHGMYLIRGSVGAWALFLPIDRRNSKRKEYKFVVVCTRSIFRTFDSWLRRASRWNAVNIHRVSSCACLPT